MFDVTPLLRLYARWRRSQLARQDPVAVQRAELLKLLGTAKATRFGRDHGFERIEEVGDFQSGVPLRRYEDFWESYWKRRFPRLTDVSWPGTIPYFAVTSGTSTGGSKNVPFSEDFARSCRKAALDILVHHLANRPESRILGGKNFVLGGSTDLKEEAPGIYSGDMSGITASRVPWWARPYYFPDPELALVADWEEKVDKLAARSLEADIRSINDTPSWMLLFFDKLRELRPGSAWRASDFYPNLELVVHGGVNFAPYRERFRQWLEGSRAETREVYPASEAFIAVADRGDGEGMRLFVDGGVFYEFVPLEEIDSSKPTRHWLANAEPDVNYALVVSTCSGLWSYIVGDTIKFVSLDPPRILVTGRTSYTLSAFGEHLIDQEIEEAVSAAAEAIGATVSDFTVAPVYPESEGEKGGHRYFVEFDEGVPPEEKRRTFARRLDEDLMATNDDYRIHRERDFGLNPPQVEALEPGTFAGWMKERGRLGGQNKVPRIINDPDLLKTLEEFVAGKR